MKTSKTLNDLKESLKQYALPGTLISSWKLSDTERYGRFTRKSIHYPSAYLKKILCVCIDDNRIWRNQSDTYIQYWYDFGFDLDIFQYWIFHISGSSGIEYFPCQFPWWEAFLFYILISYNIQRMLHVLI